MYASPVEGDVLVDRGNTFRYNSVCLDFNKHYRTHMYEYLREIDVLLVDFMEERFGLLYAQGDQSFVTDSDAFRECIEPETSERFGKAEFTEKEWMERWKWSCSKWIEDLTVWIKP